MKKSIKTKLLTTILPISTGLITPVALLSAGCQDPKLKKQLEDTKKELENKKQELDKTKKDLEEKNKSLDDAKKEIDKLKDQPKIDPKSDAKTELVVKNHTFKNFNEEYTIADTNVKSYIVKNHDEVVYVDVDEFLKALDGYVGLDLFTTIVDEANNRKIYRTFDKKGNLSNQLIFNWDKNLIHTTSTSIFYEILKPQELTDDSQFLETEYEHKNEDDKGVTFDLTKYKMDILYKDGKLLLPYTVFNTLFMSQGFTNLYFNGETFTNVFAGMDSFGATPDAARERIRKNAALNGKKATVAQREANYNHMIFTMDYFYGLRFHKNIKSFDEYIGAEEKAKLLSTDPKVYNQAYVNLFHKKLNELHTRMNSFSYYESDWSTKLRNVLKSPQDYGEYRDQFNKNRAMLVKQFETKFGKKIDDFGPDDYIRYHGNTAIVTLLGFEDGTKEQNQGPDAWKYDTYYLMRHLMAEVAKKPEIKNIVLDLAINGGGSVSSMVRTLGFMTDKPILNREYDILNRRGDLSKSKVDTDGDGKYDGDAYEKYNWSLLVSLNTFSAANQLTSIVKEMGIAKIIGKKTGGGMSAIMPIVLADGTTITISSPNNAVFGPNNESIEDGVQPDINLEYKDFYNDEAIDKALSNSK
ncbi:hypothetical protein DMC14_000435 [Metamycoplasma phocicerebrale]|uniref:Tail specific protease domain-containing protein n=1 Tax=Metamycoplasma phocicerebrale TaxID=142649 RepID=A0A3Q9VBC7_9BACT|nr:S41 family peptidase [Metamycoplasma phocicerebrale]AZZ65273.1 hypothetical protein DMC14_000435 [Metamycoplasma phocicerebrale]